MSNAYINVLENVAGKKPLSVLDKDNVTFSTAIIEHIIKALLKSKIVYRLELIYSHGLVSGITSLSMFLLKRLASLLLSGLVKSLVFKKCFCFYQVICFSFLPMPYVSFRKM